MSKLLLEVNKLTVDYDLAGRQMHALNEISFSLNRGEVVGVAGESGCGKTTLGLSIMRLLPKSAKINGGEVLFNKKNLLKYSEYQMDKEIRGKKISMIFQNPMRALNPVFKIENQMIDILRYQAKYQKNNTRRSRLEFRQQAIAKLKETGIADPDERISNYPFEFSGGMKQRVMIAMALSSKPSLIIADEPTTALDVTIEAQIIELIKALFAKYKTSILYITHDLGVLSEISDRIVVMYAGRILEMGKKEKVLKKPNHPYTAALLDALPETHKRGKRLSSLSGFVPPLDRLPPGCAFHPRCRHAERICHRTVPDLIEITPGHWSACLLKQHNVMHKWG